MKFSEYSDKAIQSDNTPQNLSSIGKLHFLILGLNASTGKLSSIVKNAVRDKVDIENRKEKIRRRLGSILWYLNTIGDLQDITLAEIAKDNLNYVTQVWHTQHLSYEMREPLSQTKEERFSDRYLFWFRPGQDPDGLDILDLIEIRKDDNGRVKEIPTGDTIDDNEYKEWGDNYRFHDAVHLGFMAYLGWSPVMRALLRLKRKSSPTVDRVEDGAKASDIEEAISKLMWVYLEENNFLENTTAVDTSFLDALPALCRGREISQCTLGMWQRAIVETAHIIRQLIDENGGYVLVKNDEDTPHLPKMQFKRTRPEEYSEACQID